MFTLSHLMPTKVGDMTKDLCYVAFKKQMGNDIKKKAFAIGVSSLRAGEKAAVKVLSACFYFVFVLQSFSYVSLCLFLKAVVLSFALFSVLFKFPLQFWN